MADILVFSDSLDQNDAMRRDASLRDKFINAGKSVHIAHIPPKDFLLHGLFDVEAQNGLQLIYCCFPYIGSLFETGTSERWKKTSFNNTPVVVAGAPNDIEDLLLDMASQMNVNIVHLYKKSELAQGDCIALVRAMEFAQKSADIVKQKIYDDALRYVLEKSTYKSAVRPQHRKTIPVGFMGCAA